MEALVSCILSTRDRPQFVPQAIRCFRRQSYPRAELIIVDGGSEPVEPLCAGDHSVRYVRAAPGATYGACLNIGAEHARGAILQTIDDDDYYQPQFLERAVAALQYANEENRIVAWDCFLVLLHDEEELRFSGHGWAAGATLCFRRELWQRTPFRDEGSHQDWQFLVDTGATIEKVCAPELYILVRHGGNSWRNLRGTDVDTYFRSLPPSGVRVCDAVDAEDAPFYSALAHPNEANRP